MLLLYPDGLRYCGQPDASVRSPLLSAVTRIL